MIACPCCYEGSIVEVHGFITAGGDDFVETGFEVEGCVACDGTGEATCECGARATAVHGSTPMCAACMDADLAWAAERAEARRFQQALAIVRSLPVA